MMLHVTTHTHTHRMMMMLHVTAHTHTHTHTHTHNDTTQDYRLFQFFSLVFPQAFTVLTHNQYFTLALPLAADSNTHARTHARRMMMMMLHVTAHTHTHTHTHTHNDTTQDYQLFQFFSLVSPQAFTVLTHNQYFTLALPLAAVDSNTHTHTHTHTPLQPAEETLVLLYMSSSQEPLFLFRSLLF